MISDNDAVAVTFEQADGEFHFRNCEVELGWTANDLIDRCGLPAAQFPRAESPDERCLAYDTIAAEGAGSSEGHYLVICARRGAHDVTLIITGATIVSVGISSFDTSNRGIVTSTGTRSGVSTGTPSGVAAVHKGDRLEGTIDGIGSLSVTVQ